MRVLLLGATGNLGKRCVPALLAHEHVLTIYVRNPSKFKSVMSPEIIQRLESIVIGDATDTATIAKTIRDHDIEGIVNVAGNQVLPWKEFLLPKIAKAVADAAMAVGNERGVPLRVCAPYMAMVQHDATCKAIEQISLTNLRWSLFCVGTMHPLDRQQTVFEPLNAPRPHNLLLGVTTLPAWVDSWWTHVPFIGEFVNIWVVLLFQYGTKYEAAADFLAEDLERGSEEFVGVRVGMKKKSKSKDD
ncbi:hypothetical protein LHYA1_G005612 [Lachnellula hyalina]|uniref:NAD(P)-binding domain-containing protein n=1 Tax=Lachnellula hyalina TaxID=1316788 RepID=A0A8H8R0U6_9HELO|nr:uncharacterized protein LHYA1_G005612 [Lachnellula hyalina]TVY26477.1 hypothetical protein LHYA1_G005612 [Lachnellula hyalina]